MAEDKELSQLEAITNPSANDLMYIVSGGNSRKIPYGNVFPKDDYYTKTQMDTALAGKQDTLTFDTTPTANSTNPVTSGGVYDFVNDKSTVTTKTDTTPYLSRSGVAIGDREYLDKVIGGTVAWNQYLQNGNFANDSASNWHPSGSAPTSYSVSNNVLTLNSGNGDRYLYAQPSLNYNHKYLITVTGYSQNTPTNNRNGGIECYLGSAQYSCAVTFTTTETTYGIIAQSAPSGSIKQIRLYSNNGNISYFSNIQLIDLTQMFGSTIADYLYSLDQTTPGSGYEYLLSYGFFTKEYYSYVTEALVSVKPSAHKMLDSSNNVLGEYPLANIELRGGISLQNNKLVFNGDEYASDGTVTRKFGVMNEINGLTRQSATSFWTSVSPGGKNGGYTLHTLSDLVTGTTIDWQGNLWIYTVNEYDSWQTAKTALQDLVIVYELGTATTETALPYTNPQICAENCVEEFVDTRDVPMPAGHSTEYIDIPSWMVNRYFNDLRELPYEVDTITKKANIYGAEWDGTANSKWTRTDSSRFFVDPQPAINNGNGFSPFDNLYPWAGMVRIEDATAGTLVSIPKFWYKWTRDGAKMKLQIADAPIDGFLTSPAHADRGDGAGERDVVYVGAYHCADNYTSKTGVTAKSTESRADFRTNIHALGSNIWQWDYAMLWTIRMLYLVEYADWNSQAKIGFGCSDSGSRQNNGLTDSMIYHTGTNAIALNQYGHIRYRGIEGLWDNAMDWCDGIYFQYENVYAIKNPVNFSDDTGGTLVGTRCKCSESTITQWTTPNIEGFEYALYPSNAITPITVNEYVGDTTIYDPIGVALRVGGSFYKGGANGNGYGLFASFGDFRATGSDVGICSRLMVLP